MTARSEKRTVVGFVIQVLTTSTSLSRHYYYTIPGDNRLQSELQVSRAQVHTFSQSQFLTKQLLHVQVQKERVHASSKGMNMSLSPSYKAQDTRRINSFTP